MLQSAVNDSHFNLNILNPCDIAPPLQSHQRANSGCSCIGADITSQINSISMTLKPKNSKMSSEINGPGLSQISEIFLFLFFPQGTNVFVDVS